MYRKTAIHVLRQTLGVVDGLLATRITAFMKFGGPSLLVLVCLGVLALPNVIRELVAMLIPGAAFSITYFVTIPIVYDSVPGYRYHNIPIIWLLVFLSGITMLLLIYSGPSSYRRRLGRE